MIRAHQVQDDKQYQDALAIRRKVFIEEQGVPLHLEIDEFEQEAVHFVVYDEEQPIGAGRFRRFDETTAKVERICILPEYRGKHIGNTLMDEIEKIADTMGFNKLKLNSQSTAIPFYEKRGYEINSPEFMDAGIPHRAMVKHQATS
ncbi:GNAT family N-acetyltransferase [Tetzosporium hominis]|uniref:GNAT family N-acetyltransferase n=1 Tax=Tetzosporium hominis TaxID=2020506 RepID=A0A264W6B1_9BACL|nr:GNAT family N-acetyltransferase [Tetzosporium hominis]OZS79123.1 GNAT family N-acetyltransferase [Tetzosporium hominis]